jgi:site-specific DNA recombinase
MAKALGSARLSRKTDESTSIERQTEQITLTAKIRGDELVKIKPGEYVTVDTDISGSVSPFLREGLGSWLTDPDKIAQWDVLIVAKVDRLTRSLSDFDDLVAWLDSQGKTLVSVSESLDLSTSTGRMFANLLAMFAQFERERMSERRKEAGAKIRENGWWAGFGIPYGSRPVKVDDHWELEPDPTTYARLERIAYDITHNHSRSAIARSLNALQVPTPAGGKEWRQNTIADIFTNEKCVLDPDLLALVLEKLDTTKTPWVKRGDAPLMLNVGYCLCGAPLYSKRYQSKGHDYEYYTCSAKCGQRRIPMRMIDKTVEYFMTDRSHGKDVPGFYAHYPVWRKIVSHGKSPKRDLNAIERKLHTLDYDAPDWRERQDELLAERQQIRADLKARASKTRYEQIPGMTVGDYWPTLDMQGQRQLLLEAGVKVHIIERQAGWKGGVKIAVETSPDVRFIELPSGGLSAS